MLGRSPASDYAAPGIADGQEMPAAQRIGILKRRIACSRGRWSVTDTVRL